MRSWNRGQTVDLMTAWNTFLYRTDSTPNGLFAVNDVVVIKINNLWSYRLWNGNIYEPNRLKVINFPVMKAHDMAGATLALINYIVFLTITNPDPLFTDWDGMHGYFRGYQDQHVGYGLLARQIVQVHGAVLDLILFLGGFQAIDAPARCFFDFTRLWSTSQGGEF